MLKPKSKDIPYKQSQKHTKPTKNELRKAALDFANLIYDVYKDEERDKVTNGQKYANTIPK